MPVDLNSNPSAVILRWIARGISLVILVVALLITFISPGESGASATELVAPIEWTALGIYALSVIGLLVAWKWERLGALLALLGVIMHDVLFYIYKGFQPAYLVGNLVVAMIFLLPACLFVIDWWMSRPQAGEAQPA